MDRAFLETLLSLLVTRSTFLSTELKKKSSFDFQAGLCVVTEQLFILAEQWVTLARGGSCAALSRSIPTPLLPPCPPQPAKPLDAGWGHHRNYKQRQANHNAQGPTGSVSKGGER